MWRTLALYIFVKITSTTCSFIHSCVQAHNWMFIYRCFTKKKKKNQVYNTKTILRKNVNLSFHAETCHGRILDVSILCMLLLAWYQVMNNYEYLHIGLFCWNVTKVGKQFEESTLDSVTASLVVYCAEAYYNCKNLPT